MFYKHLVSATAAIVMTAATFGSISSYATSIAHEGQVSPLMQTAAAAQIDAHLQLALQQTQREVQDNIASSALALVPAMTIKAPAMLIAQR